MVGTIDQFKTTDYLGYGLARHGFRCEEWDVLASCEEEKQAVDEHDIGTDIEHPIEFVDLGWDCYVVAYGGTW